MFPLAAVSAVFGGLIVFLFGLSLYYRQDARNCHERIDKAIADRNSAIKLSEQAMAAKQSAEDGFRKAKEVFEERLKLPVIATLTDEQCKQLGEYLKKELVRFTRGSELLQ